jgi:hypothetical protein
MMERTRVVFQIVGALVFTIGAAMVLIWLVDELVSRYLRFTGAMKLFLRFVWLETSKKLEMRRDMEEEEARRKIPYVPPVDDEDEDPQFADDVVMRVFKKPDQQCECIMLPQGRCGRSPAGLFKLRGWSEAVMSCNRCEEFPHSHDEDPPLTKTKDSPTPAGSGSDSDMYPGASSSQSCESGVEPRQGEGKPKP